MALLENLCCRAHFLPQQLAVQQVQARNKGEGYGIKGLLLCHHFSR